MNVPRGPFQGAGASAGSPAAPSSPLKEGPASTATALRAEGPACRQAGMPRSERLRPLQRDQVRGLLRGVRQLLIEEPTLRARPQRARLPTLHALTTLAALRGKMRSLRR